MLASCAKEADQFAERAGVETTAADDVEYGKVPLSLSVGVEDEELRYLASYFKQREGRGRVEHYPNFVFYFDVENFHKFHGKYNEDQKKDLIPGHLKQYFPGRNTFAEVTQEDLDKAPYSVGATFVGGNLHVASLVVYNSKIGASSTAASRITLQARRVNGKDMLSFTGDVNFERGSHILKSDGNMEDWYAMVFIGARYELRTVDGYLPPDMRGKDVFWRVYLGSALGENIQDSSSEVTMTNGYHNYANEPLAPGFVGLPFASNWSKLMIGGGHSSTNDPKHDLKTDMTLRMQGALVQYDVIVNVSDQLDIRRWGLISNTLDTQGSFMISPSSVEEAFNAQDTDGFGVPGWRPETPNYTADETSPAAFYLYKRGGVDPTRVENATYSFPWDLPALHTPHATAERKAPTNGLGATEIPMQDALYAYRTYIAGSGHPVAGNDSYNPDRLLADDGSYSNVQPTHNGILLSGTGRSPLADRQNFQRFIFWGMPRKQQPAQPATFLFADVHNGRFLLQAPKTPSPRSMAQQENYAAQKSMVLHQTNANFRPGRISHIQTTIESDLMITEVARDAAANRVVVEFFNPGWRTLNLSDYALVRLVPKTDGTTTSYEYFVADGTTTMDIKKATLLPLAAIDPSLDGKMDEAMTNFSDWKSVVGSGGSISGYQLGRGNKHSELAFQELVVLGTPENYWNSPFVVGVFNSPIVRRVFPLSRNKVLELRGDQHPAFALIRYYDNGRGYRIIDATAPIPTTASYSEGVSEPYPLVNSTSSYLKAMAKIAGKSYSIQRKPGVNFPSIFPYRTDLNFDDLWTVDILTGLAMGAQPTAGSIGYRSNGERLLDGFANAPKSPSNKNRNTRPLLIPGYISVDDERAPFNFNWWSTRYSKNIPSQMSY